MSITKEESIEILQHFAEIMSPGSYQETFKMAAAALRPITREQVENVWRGEWIDKRILSDTPVECSKCGEWIYGYLQYTNFCPFCGAPMTDEAVDMVMERMERLYETI